ncbi:helix-turn-helix domain-containing protein [Flavobacterium silvaticum]|uniref:AraC family transcriptional regulator n=1 Tax=Flavobacterium silvaticum TaxID=1852020 RepID=A0A972JHD1_9FLAO|nr:helix-turn-helix domain-containing protein [Flavobacterium silvaticum]NMH27810.1 AraC family transcriptional regulator [Flavobacterium silvaticum]
MFVLSVNLLNGCLLYSRFYLDFPRYHKFLLPFTLLITPFAWLYIRSVVKNDLRFNYRDLWIFAAPLLTAIDLIPYYTAPLAQKRAYLLQLYGNTDFINRFNEGMLPSYVFPFLRVIWSAVFVIMSYRLIWRFKKSLPDSAIATNRELIKWLLLINTVICAILVSALVLAVLAPYKIGHISIVDFCTGFFVILVCIQLFIRPQLLYGAFIPQSAFTIPNDESEVRETLSSTSETEITPSLIGLTVLGVDYDCRKKVEELFNTNQPFLHIDYSLQQMVTDTNIPRYVLSAFINQEYGMGFREFLNRYRVDYFKEHIDDIGWKNLTLEAIAKECGFGSRSTFIKSFKNITGQKPSEYLKARNISVPH